MASEAGAALPWGNNNIDRSDDLKVDRDLPATLGMALGVARIEVLWEIVGEDEDAENEDTAIAYTKWWGATLHRREDKATDGEGRAFYIILYDADETAGYAEPTEHVASFIDEHELFDLGEEDFLPWRMEGQEWEPPVVETNGVVDGQSSRADIEKFERVMGMNATDALRANLAQKAAHLPPDIQRDLGEKLNRGLDVLKEEIADLLDRTGDGGTVDIEAAEDAVKRMKRRLEDEEQK